MTAIVCFAEIMTYRIRNPNHLEEWIIEARNKLPFNCSFRTMRANPQRHQEMMEFLSPFLYLTQIQGPDEFNQVITLCDERVAKMRTAIEFGEDKVQFEENSNCL